MAAHQLTGNWTGLVITFDRSYRLNVWLEFLGDIVQGRFELPDVSSEQSTGAFTGLMREDKVFVLSDSQRIFEGTVFESQDSRPMVTGAVHDAGTGRTLGTATAFYSSTGHPPTAGGYGGILLPPRGGESTPVGP